MSNLLNTHEAVIQKDYEKSRRDFLERRAFLLAAGIVLLAAVLRLAIAPVITFDSDEAYTVTVARFGFYDLLTCKAFDIGNPQGFHIFLSALRQIFGENILLYRSVDSIISAISVAMVMVLCRLIVPRARVWLCVGLLMAVNPMQLTFALHIRPWSVQAVMLPLALWSVLRWRRDNKKIFLVVYVLAMFVGFNVNYSTIFFWAILVLWWLWDSRGSMKKLAVMVLVNLATVVVLLPSIMFMFWQIQHQDISRGGTLSWMFHLVGFPYFFLYGNSVARPESSYWFMLVTSIPAAILLVPLLLAGIKAVWKTVELRSLVLAMLFLPFLFLAVMSLYKPFFSSRYIAFIWPLFALTLVLGLLAFRPVIQKVALVLLLVMELAGCYGYANRFADSYPPFLLQTLRAHASEKYGIILYPDGGRQLIFQISNKPKIMMLINKPELEVSVSPDSPMDYVMSFDRTQKTLSDMLASGLPDELWFYCDMRIRNEFRDIPEAFKKVKRALADQYVLEDEWQWPNEKKAQIRLLKYHRAENQVIKKST